MSLDLRFKALCCTPSWRCCYCWPRCKLSSGCRPPCYPLSVCRHGVGVWQRRAGRLLRAPHRQAGTRPRRPHQPTTVWWPAVACTCVICSLWGRGAPRRQQSARYLLGWPPSGGSALAGSMAPASHFWFRVLHPNNHMHILLYLHVLALARAK